MKVDLKDINYKIDGGRSDKICGLTKGQINDFEEKLANLINSLNYREDDWNIASIAQEFVGLIDSKEILSLILLTYTKDVIEGSMRYLESHASDLEDFIDIMKFPSAEA